MPRYDLRNRVALVTGGARGIGFAAARALLARGAAVVITDLVPDAVQQATHRLRDQNAAVITADVRDRKAMQDAVANTVERFGGLDVVIANAGVAASAATVRATSAEQFERVLEVNLMGVCRTVDAALPEIVRRQGQVVVVSSIYAFTIGVATAPYAMSKAALEQYGRALRVELVQHGASATVAYFGFIDTELLHRGLDTDPLGDELLASVPALLRKRLSPDAAGEAIADALERRQARIFRPRRWMALSALRGLINPVVDAQLERNQRVQALLRQVDGRTGDQRLTSD